MHPVLVKLLTVLTQFNKHLILLPLCLNMKIKSVFFPQQELSQLIRGYRLFWSCHPRWMGTHSHCSLTTLGCGLLGLTHSGVECHDATKGLRESFFKAVVVPDRLGTCCQVKYRMELCEIPQGPKQAASRKSVALLTYPRCRNIP